MSTNSTALIFNITISKYEVRLIFFYRYIVSWLVPVILFVGCIGTSLCIVILLKSMKKRAKIWSWFLALSTNDIISLTLGLASLYINKLYFISDRAVPIYDDLRSSNIMVCHLFSTALYFTLFLSSWLQVGISIIRALSITYPLFIKTRFTTHAAKRALFTLIFVSLTFSLILVNTTVNYQKVYRRKTNISHAHRCMLVSKSDEIFYLVSLLFKVIIPITLLLISSVIMWKSLSTQYTRDIPFSASIKILNLATPQHLERLRRNSINRNLSLTLLGMNLTFLLSNLPFEIFKVINRNYDNSQIKVSDIDDFVTLRILDKFLNITLYLNQATNWLFYFLLGKSFRQHFGEILLCRMHHNSDKHYLIRNVRFKPSNQFDMVVGEFQNRHFDSFSGINNFDMLHNDSCAEIAI